MIKVDLDPKAELLDDFLFAELCLYIDTRISLALCVARELLLDLVVNIVGINFVRSARYDVLARTIRYYNSI
jgi:hypothetical protein